jgi:hypothetical protein
MKEQTDQRYEDMRRQAIQKNLFSGKMKPDDVKKMGYTDDQIKEIVSGKRLMAGETWGDLGNLGFPKLNIAGGAKHELSDADVDRIATERKKRGEAERSAQELYMRTVEERKGAEHDMARARIEDSMKIIESTHSETVAAREALNVHSCRGRSARRESKRSQRRNGARSSSGPLTPTRKAEPSGTSSSTRPLSQRFTTPPLRSSRRST